METLAVPFESPAAITQLVTTPAFEQDKRKCR
jgi:hypothetical protein